jgi:hypothetical protein
MEGSNGLNSNFPHCCKWNPHLNWVCIILCIQRLKIWVIETALAKQISVSLQLLLNTAEIESKFMLKEFEEKNMKQTGVNFEKIVFFYQCACHHFNCLYLWLLWTFLSSHGFVCFHLLCA